MTQLRQTYTQAKASPLERFGEAVLFPEEWIQELEQGLEVISPREHLEADVAYYATERKTYIDLLKKYYLEDTTATAYQSYTQLLAAESDIESRYELAFAQLNNSDYEAAASTLSNMLEILPDNEEEVKKHIELTALFPVLNRIVNECVMWEDLDGNERDIITDLSDNNNELPGMLAKAVRMHFDTAYIYEEPIYADREQELRMAIPKNNNKLNTKSDEQDFKVSPNPANEFVVISYEINNAINGLRLVISNATGKTVYDKELNKPKDELLITLKDYAKGNYVVTLFNNGKVVNSSKIVIQ